jgi:hypothetical protein
VTNKETLKSSGDIKLLFNTIQKDLRWDNITAFLFVNKPSDKIEPLESNNHTYRVIDYADSTGKDFQSFLLREGR